MTGESPGFNLDDLPVIEAFVNFEISKNEHELKSWKRWWNRGHLWFNYPGFPGEFKKRVKALKKVKEIVSFYVQFKEALDNAKKHGFTEKSK